MLSFIDVANIYIYDKNFERFNLTLQFELKKYQILIKIDCQISIWQKNYSARRIL